jgi:PadR family transcriptional regulator, regulatory protein PadR
VDTGSLNPALHRLERQRWIKAEWKISENNRLTPGGKRQLTHEKSRWEQISEAIAGILAPPERSNP